VSCSSFLHAGVWEYLGFVAQPVSCWKRPGRSTDGFFECGTKDKRLASYQVLLALLPCMGVALLFQLPFLYKFLNPMSLQNRATFGTL
jgi:hypothetical protein